MKHSKKMLRKKLTTSTELLEFNCEDFPCIWTCRQTSYPLIVRCVDAELDSSIGQDMATPIVRPGAFMLESEHVEILDTIEHKHVKVIKHPENDGDLIEGYGKVVEHIEGDTIPESWIVDCGMKLIILHKPEFLSNGVLSVGCCLHFSGFVVLQIFSSEEIGTT